MFFYIEVRARAVTHDIFAVFIEPMLYLPLPLKIILSHENTSVC